MSIAFAFSALHWLACAIYGGSLWLFALIFVAHLLGRGPDLQKTMRRFMAWGPGLGICGPPAPALSRLVF